MPGQKCAEGSGIVAPRSDRRAGVNLLPRLQESLVRVLIKD